MMDLKEMETLYGCDIYPKRDIRLVRGENAVVWDEKGKSYIDCVAGHGTASVGHCNPAVTEAISRQAGTLLTCPGTFYNDTRARLLEKLIRITPANLKRAFLCNSGSESIEAAIKFARFSTGKTDFISAARGFHGRTMGALSATFIRRYREPFEPLVPGFQFVPFNRFERIEAAAGPRTAGVILEIVQGEGGVHVGEGEYFRKVQTFCEERGILLIIDEVQTGFGRTGEMFACEHFGVEPDILCLAKAMAGGVPMGAVVCSDRVAVPRGNHGSTFGGNPLACAAAGAAMDYMLENDLARQALEKGAYLKKELTRFESRRVREVRGLGLMIGIELKERVQPSLVALAESGVLALPAGKTVLRLLPPLTISYQELDTVLEKLKTVLL